MKEEQVIDLLRQRVFHSAEMSRHFQDDCAVVMSPTADAFLLSTDLLIEDVHFRRAQINPENLGYKSLAVNLSDLASKGATAVGFLLSWSLPANIEEAWLTGFAKGLDTIARKFDCPLIGGDTTGSPGVISIHITVLGRPPKAKDKSLLPLASRQNGEGGDLLVVTGELGGSAMGLALQEGEIAAQKLTPEWSAAIVDKYERPRPRLSEGQWLVEHGVKAMMDLSDGVFRDVPKLAEASGRGFHLECTQLPLFDGAQATLGLNEAIRFALYGGEDYELLFAVHREDFNLLAGEFGKNFDTPLHIVGRLTNHTDAHWLDLPKASTSYPTLGFDHFLKP